ncbi:MAG: transposase, partial [Muribaculaceae bacterium]|nr:transposase [Muribaculaceae bacterium]
MFNLNENNRIVMAQHPTDMRMGVNCLSGQVRMAGLDPSGSGLPQRIRLAVPRRKSATPGHLLL